MFDVLKLDILDFFVQNTDQKEDETGTLFRIARVKDLIYSMTGRLEIVQ